MDFTPTHLYIKRHDASGLLYFGKTVEDPYIYPGSGMVWCRVLKKDRGPVSTLWTERFENRALIVEFAEFFSDFFDIVEDKKWANLTRENGLDGCPPGHRRSSEFKRKIKEKRALQVISDVTRARMSASKLGVPRPQSQKDKTREANKGLVFVNNGTINKRAKGELLTTMLNDGWVLGRLSVVRPQ